MKKANPGYIVTKRTEYHSKYELEGLCWENLPTKCFGHNSVMERFFRSLKTERLNLLSFINHIVAVIVVESYIYFYNYRRLHSSLGDITFAQRTAEMKKVA